MHWSPVSIGWLITIGSLATMGFSPIAGFLVDRLHRPRLMLGVAVLLIAVGTLAMLPLSIGFWPVLACQLLVSAGAAAVVPASSGLTLAVVGNDAFARQTGLNTAANHAGNVIAAGLVALLALAIAPAASLAVLAAMAVLGIGSLLLLPPDSLDRTRMHGREPPGKDWQAMRGLATNLPLLGLGGAVFFFNFGNGTLLPLLGQRLTIDGHNATGWIAASVLMGQLVMIPVSWLAGTLPARHGRWTALALASAALAVRAVLAAASPATWLLVPIALLDGVAAGLFSVAVPATVTGLTYGGGRTQTAMGAIGALQSGGSALSTLTGGFVAVTAGWAAAFGGLAMFPLVSIALLVWIGRKSR